MRYRPIALANLVLALAGAPIGAQGLEAYLPASAAARAARLLATIEAATAKIEARRSAERRDQLAAEGGLVSCYALISAARSGGGDWAAPDGAARSATAPAAFAQARERAKAAALALSGWPAEEAALAASREEAAASLSRLVLASGIGSKASAGLAKRLASGSKDARRVFPELAEIEGALREAGAKGSLEAAAAAVPRGVEGSASAVLAAKPEILALAPAAASALGRLEAASGAYRAWLAALPCSAYPGDLASAPDEARQALAKGVAAFAALGTARASALVGAMALGGARDAAASEAARRLADAWDASNAPRRRELALLCGLPESVMAAFASVAGRPIPASAQAAVPRADFAASAYSLGALASALADEAASEPGSAPDGSAAGRDRKAEPALLFLERPDLATLAGAEPRYASLDAEARMRLARLYSRAAEEACARIEAYQPLAKAAALALGEAPSSLVVRAVDLGAERGRRLAFVATASAASGASVSIPAPAAPAAAAYAAAFAAAARLDGAKSDSAAIASAYGQSILTAYDPEGAKDRLVVDSFPGQAPGPRLGEGQVEFAMIEGWAP